ncbi:hypothetical protein CkaCkLH20_09469 [Colletotrichum karsti]|uniref:Uncharacterized protein n=1 Tax=Colletotrichum karsti TaxID=1095194 RepID=A0A9P6HYL1_9PEZI|nr:uncharacterized protein CkaCkLH20_09469 [Colletotrichum karsti]KAF9872959.1 hypothetical protein CkaCkLH20_09469 [Colletotrichum karsti]
MLLTTLLLVVAQAHSAFSCDLWSSSQFKKDVNYQYDCIDEDSIYDLAVCLLQRNTLAQIFRCANSADDNGVTYWSVKPGSHADSLDLIPPGIGAKNSDKIRKAADDDDGELQVTPRGILLAAASTGACMHCDLDAVFRKCPYDANSQEFYDCLCCELVDDESIGCLDKCIWSNPDREYAQDKYYKPFKWTYCDTREENLCKGTPHKIVKQNKARGATASDDDTSSTASACDSTIYRVKNGKMEHVCAAEATRSIFTLNTDTTTWSKLARKTSTATTTATTTRSALYAQITGTHTVDRAEHTGQASATPDAKGGGTRVVHKAFFLGLIVSVGMLFHV